MEIIRFIISIVIVYLSGKIVQQVNLPAILGWLLAGMLIGPNVFNVLTSETMGQSWYLLLMTLAQVIVGVMIGSNLIISKIKKAGMSIFQLALFQIIGIILVVTLVFSLVFSNIGLPWYIALVMGFVAIATAPAPTLSVIKEYKTEGPLTRTTVAMTVMNSVLAALIFFTFISIFESMFSQGDSSILMSILYMLLIPIGLGFIIGWMVSKFIQKNTSGQMGMIIFTVTLVLFTLGMMYLDQQVYPEPMANYILAGAGYAAGFVNFISEDKRDAISDHFALFQSLALLVIIMNLAAPLNPSLLISAGIWSLVYLVLRFIGSSLGAYFGGKFTESDPAVQKFLGITMMPHAGISLVHAGVAASALAVIDPYYGELVQVIIPAAAIVNEIIAILLSKKAYQWAGESQDQADDNSDFVEENSNYRYQPRHLRYYENKRYRDKKAKH